MSLHDYYERRQRAAKAERDWRRINAFLAWAFILLAITNAWVSHYDRAAYDAAFAAFLRSGAKS